MLAEQLGAPQLIYLYEDANRELAVRQKDQAAVQKTKNEKLEEINDQLILQVKTLTKANAISAKRIAHVNEKCELLEAKVESLGESLAIAKSALEEKDKNMQRQIDILLQHINHLSSRITQHDVLHDQLAGPNGPIAKLQTQVSKVNQETLNHNSQLQDFQRIESKRQQFAYAKQNSG